jgi:DNA-binding IclR family transcriptional regulator
LKAAAIAARVSDRSVHGGPYRVQVLDRTLQLLDVLAQSDSDLGPSELGEKLALHRSTTHRLLKVLERHQLIRKSQIEGKYSLGIKLFELGNRVVSQSDLGTAGATHVWAELRTSSHRQIPMLPLSERWPARW